MAAVLLTSDKSALGTGGPQKMLVLLLLLNQKINTKTMKTSYVVKIIITTVFLKILNSYKFLSQTQNTDYMNVTN